MGIDQAENKYIEIMDGLLFIVKNVVDRTAFVSILEDEDLLECKIYISSSKCTHLLIYKLQNLKDYKEEQVTDSEGILTDNIIANFNSFKTVDVGENSEVEVSSNTDTDSELNVKNSNHYFETDIGDNPERNLEVITQETCPSSLYDCKNVATNIINETSSLKQEHSLSVNSDSCIEQVTEKELHIVVNNYSNPEHLLHKNKLSVNTTCNSKNNNLLKRFSKTSGKCKRIYHCNYCYKTFSCTGNKKAHERVHTGEKPFSCGYCEKTFAHLKNKQSHERVHTGERPYACRYCDKRFPHESRRSAHERIHTGEKPYSCRYCEQEFAYMKTKRIHERRHTGEKPFSCSYCDKRFTELRYKQAHERSHTGERPYSCSICKRTFMHPHSKKYHEKTHKKSEMLQDCLKTFNQLENINTDEDFTQK